MNRRLAAISVFAGAALYLALRPSASVRADSADVPNTGIADPATFLHLFNQWRAAAPPNVIRIGLVNIGPLSAELADASGQVSVNLADGSVSAYATGLPNGSWDLWLVDNKEASGATSLPESSDNAVNMGTFVPGENGAIVLAARFDSARNEGFQFDRAVIARSGQPATAFVLIGGANIYDRIRAGYVSEAQIPELASRGRSLFRAETFLGNGRRCGTCHVESNNFTIDAAFIAKLPESDPLFVHERTQGLGQNFENTQLLRKAGLILANADGLDDVRNKFTLRPVPSLQSIGTQIAAPEPVYFADFTAVGAASNPPERLGWSNDNLPLRDFAIGAIIQHMPKSLGRKPGTDFRVPTDTELDALAVYQLSIGRQEDFDLTKLKLRPLQAVRGQALYMDTGNIGEPGHKNCNACHFNGGGTGAFALNPGAPGFSPKLDGVPRGFNYTTGTNVNALPASLALRLPRDGGFGSIRLPFGSFGNIGEIPGVGKVPLEEFNSMSVVESADTAPFFHNHSVETLEEAVAFYGTPAYSAIESIGDSVAGPVPVKISSNPNDPEVQDISTFLRVLNALENVRSAVSAGERARQAVSLSDLQEIAALGREEVIDAIEVLSSGSLERTQDLSLILCRARLAAARGALNAASSAGNRAGAEQALREALTALRGSRDLLADPATLPASFRK